MNKIIDKILRHILHIIIDIMKISIIANYEIKGAAKENSICGDAKKIYHKVEWYRCNIRY